MPVRRLAARGAAWGGVAAGPGGVGAAWASRRRAPFRACTSLALRRGGGSEHGLDPIERAIRVDGEGLLVHAVVTDPQQVADQIALLQAEAWATKDVPVLEQDFEE